MYGRKIKTIREIRGFSQDYMASKLGMAQNSYSRIETDQVKKLDHLTLEKIAVELGVSVVDIVNSEPAIVNFAPNHGTQGIQHIENFYSIQKDLIDKMFTSKEAEVANLKSLYEQIIHAKDAEITRLQTMVDTLLNKK